MDPRGRAAAGDPDPQSRRRHPSLRPPNSVGRGGPHPINPGLERQDIIAGVKAESRLFRPARIAAVGSPTESPGLGRLGGHSITPQRAGAQDRGRICPQTGPSSRPVDAARTA